MTDEVPPEMLFASVCRTLEHAGFDVRSATSVDGTGLWVRQEACAVVVGWIPAQLDPAGRLNAEYHGIRSALRQALLAILTQAGFEARAKSESGEVWVRSPI
ncbi:hypothetical protein AB0M39_27425 [Streptomyces sp. NPDC051907]|uniref:hypothetical protein n=1 Tax=Streptomyces sp. NPDC051907 TaxID=3155284 RepID=UPI003426F99C